MKKYKTNFTRGCWHQWTTSKAVAEYVSNWLDSDGDRQYEFGEDYLTLTNKNIRVSNKMLLCGLSDKRDDDTKRGQFGVGAVQSLVVLTDLNYDISIINNDVLWKANFEHCPDFDHEVLVVTETPITPTGNFTVHIQGLTEDDLEEIKQRCVMFQDRKVLFSTEYGDIICNESGEGEVFCGDMYVCQNEGFRLSYNFKPKVVPLNSERSAVNNWELKKLTAKIIIATKDVDFIKKCISSNNEDTSLVNYWAADNTPDEVDDSFAQEFIEEHGVAMVTCDYDEHKQNEKLGNKSVYINNEAMVSSIKGSYIYQDAIDNVVFVEKKTPYETVYDIVDEVVDFLYFKDFIPSELHATDEEKQHPNYVVLELLNKLKEEFKNWRD